MALQVALPPILRGVLRARVSVHSNTLRPLALLSVLLFCSILAHAQIQQPLVFSSGGGVAARNDQTGVLTPVSGSPFLVTNQQLAIDVQGRFLFGIGVNSIHMYQITNTTTGAYLEVPTSPFASANTNQPLFVALEPTGKYIAVVNQIGRNQGESSVETFQIDAVNLALAPVPGSFTELDSSPVPSGGVVEPPNNQVFYVYLGPNPFSQNTVIPNGEELDALSIDPQSGLPQLIQGTPDTSTGRCFAMDPQGRYLVTGHGQFGGFIDLIGIDGTFPGAVLSLGLSNFPKALFVDSTGTFLYATYSAGQLPATVVHIYTLNLQTGAASETSSSPLPNFTAVPNFGTDPTGPFEYATGPQTDQVTAFTVDPLTGYFVQIPGSPFTVPGLNSFFFSIPPGQQPLSGPSVSFSAASLSLGTIQIGSTSPPQVISLSSNGGQALSVNSISITGADPSEFTEMDTCQAPTVLQPGKFCSISVTFTPSASGSQQASLAVTDNAPGSPQLIPLSGSGVAPPPPAPALTASPNPLTFSAITQGTTSTPLTITVTNSGTATLHIASVTIGGNNSNDFITANNCSGAISVNSNCTVSVTFAPLAAGLRTETITITDDAANSPQVINVTGNANAAFSATPVAGSSTTASVTAGQIAQYRLQLMPGPGYVGSVSFTCTGAPLGAACQVPPSVSITNGAAAPFTVTVSTSGGAMLPPLSPLPFTPYARLRVFPWLTLALLFLLIFRSRRMFGSHARANRLVWSCALAAFVSLAIFDVAGCGGGSATVTPPPIVTPPGTSTITVALSATSSSGKPLQLQPIQLTLTVK